MLTQFPPPVCAPVLREGPGRGSLNPQGRGSPAPPWCQGSCHPREGEGYRPQGSNNPRRNKKPGAECRCQWWCWLKRSLLPESAETEPWDKVKTVDGPWHPWKGVPASELDHGLLPKAAGVRPGTSREEGCSGQLLQLIFSGIRILS